MIQIAGSIPSGHLYAMVQGKMNIEAYNSCINLLIKSRLVRRDAFHVLTWIGDTDESQTTTDRT